MTAIRSPKQPSPLWCVALDAANGALLWRLQRVSAYRSAPMSYTFGGKQYVAIAAESVLYTFALP